MLDICREISANKQDGANIIRYLLYRMNNRIIKDQQAHGDEKRYAGLNISSKCMPFDRNPYSFNPKGHISNLYDLFECIDTAGHQGEMLARYIERIQIRMEFCLLQLISLQCLAYPKRLSKQ